MPYIPWIILGLIVLLIVATNIRIVQQSKAYVIERLGVFSSGVANLSPVAYQFQGYKFNRAIMLPTVTRVTQAIVGEMSTDEAMTKIAADMADAVKQATK